MRQVPIFYTRGLVDTHDMHPPNWKSVGANLFQSDGYNTNQYSIIFAEQ